MAHVLLPIDMTRRFAGLGFNDWSIRTFRARSAVSALASMYVRKPRVEILERAFPCQKSFEEPSRRGMWIFADVKVGKGVSVTIEQATGAPYERKLLLLLKRLR